MKLHYIYIPLVTFLVAAAGSYFTGLGMDWYATLTLPSFTPAGGVIGTVWTVIFVLTAVSAIILWNQARGRARARIIGLFLINACLNLLWSVLFFYGQQIFASIVEMVLLEATVIALIVLAWPVSRAAAFLLLPYAAWVAFATYLASNVWFLNK